MYLLDTNMVSDIMRNPAGVVARRMAAVDDVPIATSIIVAAELRFGAEWKGSRRLLEKLESILLRVPPLPLGQGVDVHYGCLRADLRRRGCLIGANDMWIAAHAISLGATLVTDNIGEFSRVDGLAIENWLRD